MLDLIITVDVYLLDQESKKDGIAKVMSVLHEGGLEGDVLDVQEGLRDEADPKATEQVQKAQGA